MISRVADHLRQFALGDPVTIAFFKWIGAADLNAFFSRGALDVAENPSPVGELRDEGDVHAQMCAHGTEDSVQAHRGVETGG